MKSSNEHLVVVSRKRTHLLFNHWLILDYLNIHVNCLLINFHIELENKRQKLIIF